MQVAPAELEAVLLSHPNILDAAVIPWVALINYLPAKLLREINNNSNGLQA